MKTLFSKLVLVVLLAVFVSPNIYANDGVEKTSDASTYTVSFNIAGLAATYHFTSPGSESFVYDGSGNQTIEVTGLHDAGITGIVVTFIVFPDDSDANRISIYSPNYKGSIELDDNGTVVSFTVPFNNPNVSMGLME